MCCTNYWLDVVNESRVGYDWTRWRAEYAERQALHKQRYIAKYGYKEIPDWFYDKISWPVPSYYRTGKRRRARRAAKHQIRNAQANNPDFVDFYIETKSSSYKWMYW